MEKTLVFVYNAKSGMFNKLTDFAHKLISPKTYACNLCTITYSEFEMKNEWKEFLESIKLPIEFLYQDELSQRFNIDNVSLPAIFVKKGNQLEISIDATTINACRSIADLKKIVLKKIT
ncbi:MAG: hypothetical protein ACE5I1_08845 [bacterium]